MHIFEYTHTQGLVWGSPAWPTGYSFGLMVQGQIFNSGPDDLGDQISVWRNK